MRILPSLFFSVTALVLISNGALAEPPAQLLKVLTLNFNSEDVLNDSDSRVRDIRFSALVNWVRENDPEVVLIQEAWNFHGDASVGIRLAEELGYDLNYRLDMGAPLLLYDSNVILAKPSLKMEKLKPLKLPHSAPELGDGQSWLVVFGSISYAVGARLHLANGEPLYVYTTHLIGADEKERSDQTRALGRRIDRQIKKDGLDPTTAKVMITGDFNSTSDDPSVRYLLDHGFQDTWTQAHPGDSSCTFCANPREPYFNPFTLGAGLFPDQSEEAISQRIDHFLIRGAHQSTLASTLVFTSPQNGVWMSDHYAIMSVLALNGSASEDYPNPLRDHLAPIPDPTLLKIGPEVFACDPDAETQPCEVPLPDLEVLGARGLVMTDGTDQGLEIHLKGPGMILTDPDSDLDPDTSVAFTFDSQGEFTYTIENEDGIKRHGRVLVRLN